MKKRSVTSSFDELLKNHYGDCRRVAKSANNAAGADELFANYYGDSAARKQKNGKTKPSIVQSLSYDDGEVLKQQHKHDRRGQRQGEYAYQHSTDDEPSEEYVVAGESGLSMESSVHDRLEAIPAEETSPPQECQVDIFPPPKKSNIPGSKAAPVNAPSGEQPYPQQNRSADGPPFESFDEQYPSANEEKSQAKSAEDEFIADMQSILSGQMVYDPNKKATVRKDELGQPPKGSNQNGSNEPPVPEAKNSQAIFDRIAQSMAFANTYDLGTVELENRFSDFDRISDIQQRAAKENKAKPLQTPLKQTSTAPPVDSTDFIRDLDAIREGRYGQSAHADLAVSSSMAFDAPSPSSSSRDSACVPWALTLSATESPSEYSRPLYDTGEHVRAGWDLFTDQLRVGKSPGVLFSYGELIGMPDLYQSVSHMMGAEESELKRLKTLIQRSTAHYKGLGAKNVDDEEWETATRERYLDLAEENYEHFSPDTLFPKAIFAKNAGKHGNNKTTWEKHHKWAIEEAQKMFMAPENAAVSFFPEWPLIINAFGDHFLTDAFAAGHVINKEMTIEYYKYNFYNGNALKPEGLKFFERVAELAFRGVVKQKFSVLETYDPVILWWNPNIDTVSAFRKLLIKIAEQKPDQIANLAVKALHDWLNKNGIEVTNDAGDGKWWLTGDGTLDDTNLRIIKKAVQQSVDNINDPSINASNLDFHNYYARVWKYVPRLTEPSKERVKKLSREYTSPDSEMLIKAAAELIYEKVDTLIKKLKKAKKLKDA